MTEISTSAREAECTCENPTMTPVGRCHNCYLPIAGYQARDSEGKGEAGEWPVKPNGWLIIEDHSEDGSWSGHAYSYDPRGSSINAEGARPVWLTPPAPKDEMVLKLERIAAAAARWRDAWASQDTSDAEPARKEMLAALRAFDGGER